MWIGTTYSSRERVHALPCIYRSCSELFVCSKRWLCPSALKATGPPTITPRTSRYMPYTRMRFMLYSHPSPPAITHSTGKAKGQRPGCYRTIFYSRYMYWLAAQPVAPPDVDLFGESSGCGVSAGRLRELLQRTASYRSYSCHTAPLLLPWAECIGHDQHDSRWKVSYSNVSTPVNMCVYVRGEAKVCAKYSLDTISGIIYLTFLNSFIWLTISYPLCLVQILHLFVRSLFMA